VAEAILLALLAWLLLAEAASSALSSSLLSFLQRPGALLQVGHVLVALLAVLRLLALLAAAALALPAALPPLVLALLEGIWQLLLARLSPS
jgi:hypothetical protein